MALKITELHGVDDKMAQIIKDAGLEDSDALLKVTGQPKERAELAAKLGMEERAVLELANRADLGRLKGVGVVFSDLLEFAGVDTVMELRTRNADNLFAKIQEVAVDHDVKRLPRLEDVKDWVAQAKTLERAIHY